MNRRNLLKGFLLAPLIKLRGGIKPPDPVKEKVITPVKNTDVVETVIRVWSSF